MPGIFVLVDPTGESLDCVAEMQRRLEHSKDWFAGKRFEIQKGYQGIVNFKAHLANSYAVSDTGVQVLVYGELYPYHEEGTGIASINAAQFALSLYQQHGTEFVKYISGSFCISVYDPIAEQVIVVTDRFCSKALYRDTRSEKFIISSEIKAILALSNPPQYNIKSIVNLYTYLHLLDSDTFFEGIELLPPASVLVYNLVRHTLSISSYWNYDLEAKTINSTPHDLESFIEEFDAAMMNSIRWKIGDAKRIGIFLSGGVDSRILIGYAKKIAEQTNRQICAFTFGTDKGNQSKPAQAVAQRLGIEHEFHVIPADTIAQYGWEVVWNGDGQIRIKDAHFIALLKIIREKVDCVLAGYMSDVFFGTHISEKILKFKSRQELLDHWFARAKIDFAFSQAPSLFVNNFINDFEKKAREYFEASVSNAPEAALYKVAHCWDIYQRGKRYIMPISNYPRWYVPCSDPFIDNQVVDLACSLPAELLVHKKFLRQLLELRFPELNRISFEDAPELNTSQFGQFLFRLQRYVQRRAFFAIQKYSRGKILIRNKDYRAHDYWLRTESRDFVKDILSNAASFQGLFLKQAAVEKLLNEHLTGQQDHNQLICDALNFVMMHHYFNPALPSK